MKSIDAAKICTCRDRDCPNRPVNHDQGCTPCILKNLTRREIPSCFFNLAGGTAGLDSFYFEDFAIFTKCFANP